MRGLLSFFNSSFPDLSTVRKGIMVFSCSDKMGGRIMNRLMAWLPSVQWTVVKRDGPPVQGGVHRTIYTVHHQTVWQRIRFVRALRREAVDLVVVAWTNEPSYRLLQWLGLLSNAKSVLVFNEHTDAFFFVRANVGVIIRHWLWRREFHILESSKTLVRALIRILLFPIGFLYLLIRTSYLVMRKNSSRL
jgi:hypothetical protein